MNIDREDFRLWLAAHHPEEFVGTPGSPQHCVLAEYLIARTGEVWSVVPKARSSPDRPYYHKGYDGTPDSSLALPSWANAVALGFDLSPDSTAKGVLTLLDSVDTA